MLAINVKVESYIHEFNGKVRVHPPNACQQVGEIPIELEALSREHLTCRFRIECATVGVTSH